MIKKSVLVLSIWSVFTSIAFCDSTDEIIWNDSQSCNEHNHHYKSRTIIVTQSDLDKDHTNVTFGNSAHYNKGLH